MAKNPLLIKKHMLDIQLQQELDNMAKAEDVRAKADAITLDDLDPSVRTRILNNPLSDIAYDDTDLRTRVVTLESAKMDASIAFNKNTDVVTRDMLNKDLQDVTDAAREVVNKIDADIVENTYRKLEIPIAEQDMSEDFQEKFTRMIQKVNNMAIDSASTAGLNEQVAILKQDVTSLSADKADIDYVAENYWAKNEKILVSGLEADAQDAINSIGTLNASLQEKANQTYVDGHFRRTDVEITKNDLDINLKSDIDLAAQAAADVTTAAEAVIDSYYFETILPTFIKTYGTTASADLGTDTTDRAQYAAFNDKTPSEQVDLYLNYIFPYSFYHKVAASAGTLNLPNTDERAGKATFTAFFNWVYEQLMALDSEEIAEIKRTLNNLDLDSLNQRLQDIEDQMTALDIDLINQRLQDIEDNIAAININAVNQRLQDIEDRIAALETNNG